MKVLGLLFSGRVLAIGECVRVYPEDEVERLRHLIYDAHKWLPHSPETAAAVLKRTADDYANGGS